VTLELAKFVVEVVMIGFLLVAFVLIGVRVSNANTSFKPFAKPVVEVVRIGFLLVTLVVIGLRGF
jgi:hypothetical protein